MTSQNVGFSSAKTRALSGVYTNSMMMTGLKVGRYGAVWHTA